MRLAYVWIIPFTRRAVFGDVGFLVSVSTNIVQVCTKYKYPCTVPTSPLYKTYLKKFPFMFIWLNHVDKFIQQIRIKIHYLYVPLINIYENYYLCVPKLDCCDSLGSFCFYKYSENYEFKLETWDNAYLKLNETFKHVFPFRVQEVRFLLAWNSYI